MDKKIVLIGAGSTSFGPSMFSDLYLSEVLEGSEVVLHDINKTKLDMIYDLLIIENERRNDKFTLKKTLNRHEALRGADFIISSIEVGDRMKLWRQDYNIPRKYGSTQVLGENGGPGGIFHTFRILPHIIEIVKDVEKICPDAFFINFSNPMSRVCLGIKRAVNIDFIGLCHEIHSLEHHIPILLNKSLDKLKLVVAGLNHFGFLLSLVDVTSGENLLPEFNKKVMIYLSQKEDRFEFSDLTFEVYKRFGYFPHAGDNHMGEYLQFAEEFTKTQDMIDWINHTEHQNQNIFKRALRYHKRLIKNRYPRKGFVSQFPSGERAIPIIEAILTDKNSYENSVNIPNEGIITNLPQDLVVEVPCIVNKEGIKGVKLGSIPKNIAALLRIEATIQDICVEAVLRKSRELAIVALALDVNVGSFKKAELIFEEMTKLQKEFLPIFH
jgi:alpha-galactosidase